MLRNGAGLQHVVQTSQKLGNRLFRFVTHVGEAEGLALDFAVAGIDDEMMFLAQF